MKNIKNKLIEFLITNKIVLISLQVLLYTLLVVFGFCWLFKIDIPCVDSEASFTLTMLLPSIMSGVCVALVNELDHSVSNSLAFGYVENYLEPVITDLLQKNEHVKVCLYKPKYLEDLSHDNQARFKSRLHHIDLTVVVKVLKLRNGRNPDIHELINTEGQILFFDFVNTLRSLNVQIEYKLALEKPKVYSIRRLALEESYIKAFYSKVTELVTKKGLLQHVKFCSDLDEINF